MGSAHWDSRYAGSELVWTAEPNRFLVAETRDLRPGRALDLACGEGRNAVWLATQGWEVTGIDFSRVGLEKAAQLAESRDVSVDWVEADVTAFEPETQAFDLVAVLYLQLPAAARAAALRRAAGAVAPGGTLLVVAHDSANLEHGYGGPQRPDVLYTADDVATDIAEAGLTIERGEVVERPVPTVEGERVALDALVRAVRPAT